MDPTGNVTAVQVKLNGENQMRSSANTVDFSAIGQIFGSAIGRAIAGNNNQFVPLAAGTVAGFVGQKFVQALINGPGAIDLANVDISDVFFGQQVSLAGAGLGAASSFLTAELATSIGLERRRRADVQCRGRRLSRQRAQSGAPAGLQRAHGRHRLERRAARLRGQHRQRVRAPSSPISSCMPKASTARSAASLPARSAARWPIRSAWARHRVERVPAGRRLVLRHHHRHHARRRHRRRSRLSESRPRRPDSRLRPTHFTEPAGRHRRSWQRGRLRSDGRSGHQDRQQLSRCHPWRRRSPTAAR